MNTIRHHLAERETDLCEYLTDTLPCEPSFALWLVELGSVYVNHQRARANMQLKLADYVRVHANPRRFPVDIDWTKRIVFDHPDFVVVDKPAGMPTHASVDNLWENTAAQVSKFLNHEVFVTHRLDVATSGLLVLAKTKPFQRQFNFALRDGSVKKEYLAQVVQAPVERGLIRHYMETGTFLPKKVSREATEGWQECLLEIKNVWTEPDGNYVHVRLLTGRTHQIRAQLSDLGAPILGDKLYGGESPWHSIEKIGLRSFHLEFTLPSTTDLSCEKSYVFSANIKETN